MRDAHFLHGAFESKPEQLSFAFPERKMGVSFLRGGAVRYAARQGRQYSSAGLSELQSDPRFQTRVGQVYEAAQVVPSHRVRRAYEAMRDETVAQFDYLTRPRHQGGLGVKVEFTDEDPYPHQQAMQADIHQNRRLKVYKTAATGSHPFFTDEENDKFRAVHDAFGHAAIGRSFSRHGEEAAYHSHAQMYSPVAREAMAAETRGQNSAFIYRRGGQTFPEQKMITLPSWAQKMRTRPSR
jgi:hypothetical protein